MPNYSMISHMHFCRKDKYQKGLRLYWVDTFITGEVETAAEERLEDEVDCGEKEQDWVQLGGVTPEEMPGSDSESADNDAGDDDDDDDAKTDTSSPSKRRKRAKSSRKRGNSSSPGKPSPKWRRKNKDDDLEEERFAEAHIPNKPQKDFQQYPRKALKLNPSPHLLQEIENAADVLENVLRVQGRLEITSKKLVKMNTPDALKLLG